MVEKGDCSSRELPEVQALVPEIESLLHLLRIERPPLGAANTPSIRQRG